VTFFHWVEVIEQNLLAVIAKHQISDEAKYAIDHSAGLIAKREDISEFFGVP
jgi:hypothetical protein